MFESLLWKPDESGLQRWRRLADMIRTSWMVLDQMVRTNGWILARCQDCYRHMLEIRDGMGVPGSPV